MSAVTRSRAASDQCGSFPSSKHGQQNERLMIAHYLERRRAGVVDPERDHGAARLLIGKQFDKHGDQATLTAAQKEQERQERHRQEQERAAQDKKRQEAEAKRLGDGYATHTEGAEERQTEKERRVQETLRQMREQRTRHGQRERGGGGRTRQR